MGRRGDFDMHNSNECIITVRRHTKDDEWRGGALSEFQHVARLVLDTFLKTQNTVGIRSLDPDVRFGLALPFSRHL